MRSANSDAVGYCTFKVEQCDCSRVNARNAFRFQGDGCERDWASGWGKMENSYLRLWDIDCHSCFFLFCSIRRVPWASTSFSWFQDLGCLCRSGEQKNSTLDFDLCGLARDRKTFFNALETYESVCLFFPGAIVVRFAVRNVGKCRLFGAR